MLSYFVSCFFYAFVSVIVAIHRTNRNFTIQFYFYFYLFIILLTIALSIVLSIGVGSFELFWRNENIKKSEGKANYTLNTLSFYLPSSFLCLSPKKKVKHVRALLKRTYSSPNFLCARNKYVCFFLFCFVAFASFVIICLP